MTTDLNSHNRRCSRIPLDFKCGTMGDDVVQQVNIASSFAVLVAAACLITLFMLDGTTLGWVCAGGSAIIFGCHSIPAKHPVMKVFYFSLCLARFDSFTSFFAGHSEGGCGYLHRIRHAWQCHDNLNPHICDGANHHA